MIEFFWKLARRRTGVAFFFLWPLALLPTALHGGPIFVPNASFESPTTIFVTLNLDSWQRTPQPDNWDTNQSGDWSTLVGFFKNTPVGSFDHIDNCDGNQVMWLFANPDAGIFQDYDSVDWNDAAPTHNFDAVYEVGYAYQLTVGILVGGLGSGGGVTPGATVEFSLYYRDANSNRVTVAATTITNSSSVFSNSTHLLDFSVTTPVVQPDDPWAGEHIGILLLSTSPPDLMAEGYWDLDNVRLNSIMAPRLTEPVRTNDEFQFTIQSEPGMVLEVLAHTNAIAPISDWTNLRTITNSTGTIPFVDTAPDFSQRFYRVRQRP